MNSLLVSGQATDIEDAVCFASVDQPTCEEPRSNGGAQHRRAHDPFRRTLEEPQSGNRCQDVIGVSSFNPNVVPPGKICAVIMVNFHELT